MASSDPDPGPELGHEGDQVERDGARADVELLADLGIRPPPLDREKNRFLTAGQRLEGLSGDGSAVEVTLLLAVARAAWTWRGRAVE